MSKTWIGKLIPISLIFWLLLTGVAGAQEDLLTQGQAAYQAGNYGQAAQLLGQYIRDHPEAPPEAYGFQAQALAHLRQPQEALQVLARGLDKYPNDISLALLQGRLWEKMERYEEAISSFSRIISGHPGFVDAWRERGAAYLKLGRLEEAQQDLEEAGRRAPEDPLVQLYQGLLKTRQGNYLGAEADFSTALQLQSPFPEAYYHRGNLYFYHLFQKDKAVADYRQACRQGYPQACRQLEALEIKPDTPGELAGQPRAGGQDPEAIIAKGLKGLESVPGAKDGSGSTGDTGVSLPLAGPPKGKARGPSLKDILRAILGEVPVPLVLITMLFFFCLMEGLILVASNEERRHKKRLQKRLKYLQGLEKSQSQASLLKADGFSDIPWLRQWLKRTGRLEQLQALLDQADLSISVGTFVLVTLLSGAVAFSLGSYKLGQLGGLGGLALGLFLPYQLILLKKKLRIRKFEKQLPEALDLMARGLKAGHAFPAGLQMVAEEMPNPIGMEFFKTFKEYNHGMDLNTALMNMCQRVDLQELRFFTTAVMIQRETGGNLTDILEKIASLIRERFKLLNHIKALTAEGRLSGLVLILLPPGLFLGMLKLNREYVMMLVNHDLGRKMAMIAIFFQLVGILAIRKIVNIKM